MSTGAEQRVLQATVPRGDAAAMLRHVLQHGPFPVLYWRAPHEQSYFIAAGEAYRTDTPRNQSALQGLPAAGRSFDPLPLLYMLPFDMSRTVASPRYWIPELYYHAQANTSELLSCTSEKKQNAFLALIRSTLQLAATAPEASGNTAAAASPASSDDAVRCEHNGGDTENMRNANKLNEVQGVEAASGTAGLELLSDISTSDEQYRVQVRTGLAAIHDDALQKIVLARRMALRAADRVDAQRVWEQLNASHPDCYSLLYAAAEDDVFISATPERLARVEGGRFMSAAVAGTLPLDEGEGELRGGFASDKLADEHGQVVEMIREAASAFCSGVQSGEAEIRKYRGYAHLSTPVSGTLNSGESILSAVAALHPTPAVAGEPREEAMRRIPGIEGFDRGLYAGVAGWMRADGDGEAAVTIRSIHIQGRRAEVYAGAGIVRNSDADAENAETLLKLRPLLDALNIRR